MMINGLGNALRRMAVARDYWTTRMTLLVYIWNGEKRPGLGEFSLRYFADKKP